MNKQRTSIVIISIVLLLTVLTFQYLGNQKKEYESTLFYMDTYISVKIYTNDKEKANKALDGVDALYKRYHQLTDRYNSYPDLVNVYYINHNTDKINNFTVPNELCNIIEYGINWYDKSNGLLNINIGNAIDVWKPYREAESGIPTNEELASITNTDIKNIKFISKCVLENNHPNIDLGAIAKGFTTQVVGDYLKSMGINEYIINAGGNALVGNRYHNDVYHIGITDPTNTSKVFQVVEGENIAVVTSGSYERFYEYEGKIYHHILDPKTFMPVNYMKSVSIITKDSALGDALSTTLFLMSIEEGKEFIKNYDVQVIWYDNNNNIIKSDGFSKYE